MSYVELALKILGVVMATFAWTCVAFPRIQVGWKGGNRAPLSRRSKLILAIGWTAWCCAVFRFHPLFFGSVFAASVLFLFPQSMRDREGFDASKGIRSIRKALTPSQYWPALWVLDALVLAGSLYAVFRDLLYPPQTQEQHILHIMGICYLVVSSVGAVYLYVKRPGRRSSDQE